MQCAEHHMACQRRLDGDFRRFQIADLAHQDDIRVVAQNRTQAGGEGDADVRINRYLNDSVDTVFNGVFRGNQLVGDLVQLAERRVQRRGLARPRGAGNQHDAVGNVNHLAHSLQRLFVHPNLFQIQRHHRAVQHPHDHAFTEHGG